MFLKRETVHEENFLRRWGVGNKGCHDGIVLAFVKNLKTVSLATRGTTELKCDQGEI